MYTSSTLRRAVAAGMLSLVAAAPAGMAQAAPAVQTPTADPGVQRAVAAIRPDPRIENDARLKQARTILAANRPLTITVLGDSVGNDPGEWVSKFGQGLATDRVVVVHHFDWQRVAWLRPTEVFGPEGDPAKPQLTVWNFGWPGGTPLRAAQHLKVGVPTKPDLAIVSFGHNLGPAAVVPHHDALAAALTKRWGRVPTVTTIAHMTPVVRPGQAEGRARLVQWLQARRLPYLDKRTVFDTVTDQRTVFHDAVHPNWLGYRLIADLVDAALSPSGPAGTRPAPKPAAVYSATKARATLVRYTQTRSNRTTTIKATYAFRDGFGRPMAHAWVTMGLSGPRGTKASLETDAGGRVTGIVSIANGGTGKLTATANDGFTTLSARPGVVRAR
ncbi:MAG: SGNH/GDSL hydrolase family protein [Micrococcales bacterium]|nr:SGNH/GDSL hydrolase family protein [Micrococcales bacterium]